MHTSALALPLDRSKKGLGDPYLKIQLDGQTSAIFNMQHVQEVVMLPVRRLTPMPNLPACLLGLTNRRSRILWIVDLARMLEIAVLPAATQQHSVVIVQVGAMPLGLAVRQVEGIVWVQSSMIQSPPGQISAPLVPYLQGCVLQQREISLVLDVEAIAQSSQLRC